MYQFLKADSKTTQVGKALFLMYLITAALLLLLAFFLFRLQLSEEIVTVGILVAYVISTFIGGFYIGKRIRNKKFVWGFVAGFSYFILLLLVSLAINRSLSGELGNVITTMIICVCGGTFGGMVA